MTEPFVPSRPEAEPETCSLCEREIPAWDFQDGMVLADLMAGWFPMVMCRWCAAKRVISDGGDA